MDKVILDPSFRRMGNIFTEHDLERLRSVCDLVWAKDEPMPDTQIEKVRSEAVAIIAGSWRYGDVGQFPNLRAILSTGAKVATIFGKTWRLHVEKQLRITLQENLKLIHDSVRFLKDEGLEVIYDAEHFYSGWKEKPEFLMAEVTRSLLSLTAPSARPTVVKDGNLYSRSVSTSII